jgi:hypothetical protein
LKKLLLGKRKDQNSIKKVNSYLLWVLTLFLFFFLFFINKMFKNLE